MPDQRKNEIDDQSDNENSEIYDIYDSEKRRVQFSETVLREFLQFSDRK